MRRVLQTTALILLSMLMSLSVNAEQFERVDNYQIHYSAINTSFLTPEVAAAYDIQRSKVMALLSVSVLEDQSDGSIRPVQASVEGTVGNLAGQSQPLSFRTVREDGAIYQLAVFRIQEGEPMRFNLEVSYDRNEEPAEIAFMQRFFVE